MHNILSGEAALVESLATSIKKKLVNPTEEQIKQLDNKINNLSADSEASNLSLREELDGLSEKVLAIKKELTLLLSWYKKVRLVALIALTWAAVNTYILVFR